MTTTTQRRAVGTLAAHVGPAIVWGIWTADDRYIACTDTTPGLDLEITAAGGIATPLDDFGPDRMRGAMSDDTPRVLRIVSDMLRHV